jgi:hypothetical protein
LKKLLLIPTLAAFIMSPLFTQNEVLGQEAEEWKGSSEELSFYRVSRGFISPLYELDNNLETKLSFTKLDQSSSLDYYFPKSMYLSEIRFDTDTPRYQRIVLMRSGVLQTYELSQYPSGVIKIPSILVSQIRYQFNGVVGTEHRLNELEFFGTQTTFNGATPTITDKIFVTPEMVEDVILESSSTSSGSDGEPEGEVIPEVPVSEGSTIESDETPVEGEVLPEVLPTSTDSPSDGEFVPLPEEEIIVPVGDGLVGDGESFEEIIIEEEVVDNIGNSVFVDNGEKEEEVPVVEAGDVVVPEVPVTEEPIVNTPPVLVEEPVVIIPPVLVNPLDRLLHCEDCEINTVDKAKPLTAAVFSNKHNYLYYKVNAASLKLLSHNQYNEDFLRNKLANSLIVDGKDIMTVDQFIELLNKK